MNYDVANDRVVVITLETMNKVQVYDPTENRFTTTPGAMPKEFRQMNGFYDPVLNVYFIHTAIDNAEGPMWAYRYKSVPGK
jgi:hypothetical protein